MGKYLEIDIIQIFLELKYLRGELRKMALDLTNLINVVTAEKNAEQSAIVLLGNLTQSIQTLINNSANTVDPVQLQGIINDITTNTSALAAAVVANTPVGPTVPPPTGSSTAKSS